MHGYIACEATLGSRFKCLIWSHTHISAPSLSTPSIMPFRTQIPLYLIYSLDFSSEERNNASKTKAKAEAGMTSRFLYFFFFPHFFRKCIFKRWKSCPLVRRNRLIYVELLLFCFNHQTWNPSKPGASTINKIIWLNHDAAAFVF